MTVCLSYPDAANLPERSLWLRRLRGAQGDAATALLPLARTHAPSDLQELDVVGDDWQLPIPVPAAGLGVFLGAGRGADSNGRVFVNLQTGGEVLYIDAPVEVMATLIGRAACVGAPVGVHLPESAWAWVRDADPELITVGVGTRRNRFAVEVYQGGEEPMARHPQTAVLAWAPRAVPEGAAYHMRVSPEGVGLIRTPAGRAEFQWAMSNAETQWYRTHAAQRAVRTNTRVEYATNTP